MIKKVLILLLICFAGHSFGNTPPKKRAANVIFVELLGNGLALSCNYERVVEQKLGFRFGFSLPNMVVTAIPLMINYYPAGERSLELGLGATIVNKSYIDAFGKNNVLIAMTIGHKYHPQNGGVAVRFSLTPFFNTKESKFQFYGGISVGYTF